MIGSMIPDTNPTEVFQGCLVQEVTPHGAVDIDAKDLPKDDVGGLLDRPDRRYGEVIWAPVEPVRLKLRLKKARLADGLGGIVQNRRVTPVWSLANPALFSLPSDSVVPGQRQAAIDCICKQLAAKNLPGDLFSEFGVVGDTNRYCFGKGRGPATPFRPLSSAHTDYGVAQFSYGTIVGEFSGMPLRFRNPGPVTQVAALLVYSRHLEDVDGRLDTNPTEVFQGCFVREVTPHGAVDIGTDLLPKNDVGGLLSHPDRRYGEVIWAPVEPVRLKLRLKKARLADGLGGQVLYFLLNGGAAHTWSLANPVLFTLPSDSVVQGQRQAAIDCICDELEQMGESPALFKKVGVRCEDKAK